MSQVSSFANDVRNGTAIDVRDMTPDELKSHLIYQIDTTDESIQQVKSYQNMARSLAAEQDWLGLGRLINNANRNGRVAGDGTRIAAAAIQAVWDSAIAETGQDDLTGMGNAAQVFIDTSLEHPTNDGLRALAGHVAIRLGTRHLECRNASTAKGWFDLATDLVIDPGETPSPINGRLSYELVTGAGTDIHDLTTAFRCWQSHDANDTEALALHGWNLLPENYGSYDLLHETARELHESGSKVAAFYWEAIAADAKALVAMEFDLFRASLKDLIASSEDRNVAINGICGHLYSLGNRSQDRKGEASEISARRNEIDTLFDEIVRSELGPVLPHRWESEDAILYGLASAYAAEIQNNEKVTVGSHAFPAE